MIFLVKSIKKNEKTCILIFHFQGGQNFFEPNRTKIRTFSEEIRTIRTIFEKQSVQFFFKKIRTIRTFF